MNDRNGIGPGVATQLLARPCYIVRMVPRGCALVAVLALLWTALGSVSSACAQDDLAAAKVHFSKGTRLYEVGEYYQALGEFKAAHLAKPDPAFLFNIAQCHRQLGDLEQAVTMYKRFLAASPGAGNRAEVEKRVAEMEADLAVRKRKAATAESPTAPVATQAAASAPPPVAAASGPIYPPLPVLPTTPGVSLQPVSTAAGAAPTHPGSSLRNWRWVGVGVTVALVGGAVVSGVLASSRFDDLKKSCGATSAGCSDSDISGLKSRALLTNILWGAAGVAAVGTGVFFYLTPSESVIQVAGRF